MPRWLGNILSYIFGPLINKIFPRDQEARRTDPDNDGSTG